MDGNYPAPSRTSLSKEQKAAFVLLIVLGIVGLFLGFYSFGASIRGPIEKQIASFGADRFLTPSQKDAEEQEKMKTRDTDGDGLVDYDEVYVFKTSAYLADSDSDGFDDRTEAYSGNDPNCPAGRSCGRGEEAARPNAPVAEEPPTPPVQDYQSPEAYLDLFKNLPPEQLKAMLVQAGVPREKLEGLSEEELKTLFEQAFAEALQADASASTTTESETSPTP